MYKHKTTFIKCFCSFCSKPLWLETPIIRSNVNFPWQFELSRFNCIDFTTCKYKSYLIFSVYLLPNLSVNMPCYLVSVPAPTRSDRRNENQTSRMSGGWGAVTHDRGDPGYDSNPVRHAGEPRYHAAHWAQHCQDSSYSPGQGGRRNHAHLAASCERNEQLCNPVPWTWNAAVSCRDSFGRRDGEE